VVDDHPQNIAVLSNAVAAVGFDFDTAADGLEAIERLAARDYALVLLDYHMPRLSGDKVMLWLHNRAQPPPRVLVLTSDARPETEAMFRAMGCTGFMAKPVDLPVLVAEIGRILKDWI
jgi:CheY-like chemotaxis protein